jgi:hypothetical protein
MHSPSEVPGSPVQTLKLVLTSPEHRPQRVAGMVVCSLAALVIFVVGRSPVTGTDSIGQTTGALSVEPSAADDEPDPLLADPAPSAAEANRRPPVDDPLNEMVQALPGKELAPGLVVPPTEGEADAAKRDKAEAAAESAESESKTSPPAPGPPAASPPRSKPRRARRPTSRPKNYRNTEFDFGI